MEVEGWKDAKKWLKQMQKTGLSINGVKQHIADNKAAGYEKARERV
jgi:hypothetical protein